MVRIFDVGLGFGLGVCLGPGVGAVVVVVVVVIVIDVCFSCYLPIVLASASLCLYSCL